MILAELMWEDEQAFQNHKTKVELQIRIWIGGWNQGY